MRAHPFLLLLVAAACNKTSDVAPIVDASTTPLPDSGPSPVQSAAHSASAKPTTAIVSKLTVYVGEVNKERVSLGVERRGDDVRAALVQGYAVPIDLVGKTNADGTVSIKERGFLTRKGSSIDFSVNEKGELTGTLNDPKAKAPQKLALTPKTPFTDKDDVFEKSYEGSLGASTRVRAKWKRDKHLVSGVYRYARSKEDLKLDGTVVASDGSFDLTEKNAKGTVTGKWHGVFVSPSVVLARWTSPDGSKDYPLSLTAGEPYPEIVTLVGGGKIAPQEQYAERGKSCRASVVYPAFDGLPSKSAETALNGKLRTLAGVGVPLKAEDCEGAEEFLPYDFETAYSITAQRPTFVGLQISQYAFTGGAHGNWGAQCHVADLASGRVVQLGKELSAEALDKLSSLARAELEKENSTKALSDVGFFTDDPKVTADTSLCAQDDKGVLSLEVSFAPYEIGPWAMGSPSVQIPSAVAVGLFSPGTMGNAIFK